MQCRLEHNTWYMMMKRLVTLSCCLRLFTLQVLAFNFKWAFRPRLLTGCKHMCHLFGCRLYRVCIMQYTCSFVVDTSTLSSTVLQHWLNSRSWFRIQVSLPPLIVDRTQTHVSSLWMQALPCLHYARHVFFRSWYKHIIINSLATLA